MSPLRDVFIAPAPADAAAPVQAPRSGRAHAVGRSLGVLAPARDLTAVACAAGLVIARGAPTALVCLRLPGGVVSAPVLRAPVRGAAARLRASLTARGLAAEARGRLVLACLPSDPGEASSAAQRALAAADALPTVVAAAMRDEETDAVLAAQGAILVALPACAGASLAELALAGAAQLAPQAATLALALDPVQRVMALAGLHAPRVVRSVVEGVLT